MLSSKSRDMKTQKKTKDNSLSKEAKRKKEQPNTKVESDTGKRPEKDTNPLPPNPNKVDNHE